MFLEVQWKFPKAVGVGETIVGRVDVIELRDDKPICQLTTKVLNGDGEV